MDTLELSLWRIEDGDDLQFVASATFEGALAGWRAHLCEVDGLTSEEAARAWPTTVKLEHDGGVLFGPDVAGRS